ncbi:hypothetical protein CEXT_715251 [Caerostris extrusa]|uniref:Uncharacterized protein n=1 Tax=Caerostris extrusa TaxID=172846 RepID=A0AAV4WXA5_CAEEX|nr:hypothetical protein CEXT_715251 [Caerostris extrusa]
MSNHPVAIFQHDNARTYYDSLSRSSFRIVGTFHLDKKVTKPFSNRTCMGHGKLTTPNWITIEKRMPNCVCDFDTEDRKRVTCNRGGLSEIPTLHMDVDIQVLIITAPPNHYNELTIGRIFLDFHELEEVRITYSKLPAIDLSYNGIAASPSAPFRLLPNLRTLSLAKNKLRTLVPRFFYMLAKLEKLDLSGNPLRDIDPENLKDVRPLKGFIWLNVS